MLLGVLRDLFNVRLPPARRISHCGDGNCRPLGGRTVAPAVVKRVVVQFSVIIQEVVISVVAMFGWRWSRRLSLLVDRLIVSAEAAADRRG